MLRVTNHFPAVIDIDGEPVRLRIRRLTREQWIDFSLEFARMQKATRGAALVVERKPGEEALSAEDLEAKRWAELTPEAQQAHQALDRAEQIRQAQVIVDAIVAYVTVEPDQIFDEEAGTMVTDGAGLVRVYAQRQDVLSTLGAEIFIQNRLSGDQKKILRSLRDSARGSAASAMGPGGTPGPTAAPAANEGSATSEGATDVPVRIPSGVMGTSS